MTHLEEFKVAVANALESLAGIEVKGNNVKVKFDVIVSPACCSYFAQNGYSQLHIYAWTIQSLVVQPQNTIAVEMVGEWQDRTGYRN